MLMNTTFLEDSFLIKWQSRAGQITYYIVEKEDFVVNCLEKARRTPVYAR